MGKQFPAIFHVLDPNIEFPPPRPIHDLTGIEPEIVTIGMLLKLFKSLLTGLPISALTILDQSGSLNTCHVAVSPDRDSFNNNINSIVLLPTI